MPEVKRVWHIASGKVEQAIEAGSFEEAAVAVIRANDLTLFSELICGWNDGRNIDSSDTLWAITEWYLPKAGYTLLKQNTGEILWKKKSGTADPSSGDVGLKANTEGIARTSKPSPAKNTSSTASIGHLKQDEMLKKPLVSYKRPIDFKKLRLDYTVHRPVKVNSGRTPEQWQEILRQARQKK